MLRESLALLGESEGGDLRDREGEREREGATGAGAGAGVGVGVGVDAGAALLTRGETCRHQTDAPKHSDLDCSLRRLNEQELYVARLEMFCDQLFYDDGEDSGAQVQGRQSTVEGEEEAAGAEAAGAGRERDEVNIVSLLNENSSDIEFEQRLREFEGRLERHYKSREELSEITACLQVVTRQLGSRRKRLEAALSHGLKNGSKALLSHLVRMCWRRAFAEFYAMKSLGMRNLPHTLPDSPAADASALGLQDVVSMSPQQAKRLLDSQDELKLKLQLEETKNMGLRAELGASRDELAQLSREIDELNPGESTINSMSLADLETVMESLEAKVTRLKMRKASLIVEQSNKCCVCWSNAKEIAFQCGHQTCHACSERIETCPICRVAIDIRIKLY